MICLDLVVALIDNAEPRASKATAIDRLLIKLSTKLSFNTLGGKFMVSHGVMIRLFWLIVRFSPRVFSMASWNSVED